MRDGDDALTTEDAVEAALASKSGSAPFSVSTLQGLTVPPRLWHVENMIPARAVTLLGGVGGSGKSTLALQLAAATCLNSKWLGLEPKHGAVLYLSAEDDRDELHRRMDALSVFYGSPLDEMIDLMLWDLADHSPALAEQSNASDAIVMTNLWRDLEKQVDTLKPKLIVLDSAADVFAGNENSRPQVRQFVGALRGLALRSEAAVVLLGHPSLEGIRSGSGLSGSTAWNNSVRSRLVLAAKDDTDRELLTLTVMKANYGPTGGEVQVRRQGGGYGVVGGTGVKIDAKSQRAIIDDTFLKLLDRYEAQSRIVSDRPGANYAPARLAADPESGSATKKAFEDAMNRLFRLNHLEVRTIGPPSRPQRQLVRAADIAGDRNQ